MSDPDTGGWCAPQEAMCACGQVFDETHDLALCRRLLPISDESLVLLTDYIVTRGKKL